MRYIHVCLTLFLFLSSTFAINANAAIFTGDFRTESDVPPISSSGPLVYENLGAYVGVGKELDDSHFVENPSNWLGGVVHMDLDSMTNILTLTSQDNYNFLTFVASITNMNFDSAESITGISLIGGEITSPDFIPVVSYTSNSVLINYDQRYFDFTGGTATFQITTSPVPLPAAAWLFGSALLGLAGIARRKKA